MDSSAKFSVFVIFVCTLLIQGSLGEVICEDLPSNLCSFSISSSGKRCLLENYVNNNGDVAYQCRASEVMVERMAEHIENDKCVSACGVERGTVGISSDALLESRFVAKLCSPQCFQNCPNILDLYFNLAAGEGVFLPDLCERQRSNPRREMVELSSSGFAAGPMSSSMAADFTAEAPAPAFM